MQSTSTSCGELVDVVQQGGRHGYPACTANRTTGSEGRLVGILARGSKEAVLLDGEGALNRGKIE